MPDPPAVGAHRAAGELAARNSVAAFALFGAQIVAGLIALPIALHALGSSRFGLVSFVTGFALFLQFVELGLSVGLSRFTASYAVTGNRTELQSFVSDAYFVALIGNAVVAVGMIAIGLFAGPLLNIKPGQQQAFTLISIIVGVTSAVNGVLNVPRGVLAGLQLTGLRTRRDLIGAFGPVIAAIVVATVSESVVTYTLITQLASVLGGLLVLHATRHTLPWVHHIPHRGKATFRRFLTYSGYQVINQAADIVFLTSDRIVVQTLIGSVGVTNYSIVERLQKLSDSVVSIPINAVLPITTGAWERDDRRLLERVIGSGTRLYLGVILPPLAVLIGLMRPFLKHWVGPAYVHLALSGQLFVLSLAGPAFVRAFAVMLAGKGRFRPNVVTKCIYAPINLGVSIFLANRLGVIGVIIPTTAYYVCVFPVLQLWLMHDEAFSVRRFLFDVAPIFGAALPISLALLVWRPRLAMSSIIGFLACGIPALLLSYAFVIVALSASERRLGLMTLRRRLP